MREGLLYFSFSMLLMSALMGLVFLSSGTGHDASVDNDLDTLDPAAKRGDRRTIGWKDGAER